MNSWPPRKIPKAKPLLTSASPKMALDSIGKSRTPSQKRKRLQNTTSQKTKRGKTVVQPTPHSKAALDRKQRATSSPYICKTFTSRLPEQSLTFQASMAHVPKDLRLRSIHALYVGSPEAGFVALSGGRVQARSEVCRRINGGGKWRMYL